jgi:hypothetical protein
MATFQYPDGAKEVAPAGTPVEQLLAKHKFRAVDAKALVDFINALLSALGLTWVVDATTGVVTGTLTKLVIPVADDEELAKLTAFIQSAVTSLLAGKADAAALLALQTSLAAQLQAITGLDATQTAAIQAAQAALVADDNLLNGLLATQQQQATLLATPAFALDSTQFEQNGTTNVTVNGSVVTVPLYRLSAEFLATLGPATPPAGGTTTALALSGTTSAANFTSNADGTYNCRQGSGAVFAPPIAAGTDGNFSFEVPNLTNTLDSVWGLGTGNTATGWQGIDLSIWLQPGGSPQYNIIQAGSIKTPANVVIAAAGDVVRARVAGTSLILEVTQGSTTTLLYTLANQPTAARYAKVSSAGGDVGIYNPTGFNVAAT